MHKVHRRFLLGPLTHYGRVCAVLDASHRVDAGEDGADVVLVELDGVGVCEEVIALGGSGRPVRVCAPAHKHHASALFSTFVCLITTIATPALSCHGIGGYQERRAYTQRDMQPCLEIRFTPK